MQLENIQNLIIDYLHALHHCVGSLSQLAGFGKGVFEIIQGRQKRFDDGFFLVGSGVGDLLCDAFLIIDIIGADTLKLREEYRPFPSAAARTAPSCRAALFEYHAVPHAYRAARRQYPAAEARYLDFYFCASSVITKILFEFFKKADALRHHILIFRGGEFPQQLFLFCVELSWAIRRAT